MAEWAKGTALLTFAGWCSGALVLLHVGIVIAGVPAYRYFDAGEEVVRLAEQGSVVPPLLTLFVAGVFAVFALFAFSGAGRIRRLPLSRTALFGIGAIYTLRGLFLLPELVATPEPRRELVFSATSLVIGVAHLAGTARSLRRLRPGAAAPMP